jgi:hypothetical protein
MPGQLENSQEVNNLTFMKPESQQLDFQEAQKAKTSNEPPT